MKKAIRATVNCCKIGRLTLIPLLFILLTNYANGQCTLSCEGTVQVSLDSNCEAVITPAVMLSDDGASCPGGNFIVELSNHYGIIPGNVLTAANIGESITARIIETNTGNSCWGNVILEDKLGPQIDFCPSDPIVISCSAFESYPGPIFIDACEGPVPAILLNEEIRTLDCNVDYVKEVIRVYYAEDSNGYPSQRCTITYNLARIDLVDVVCPDSYLVAEDTALNCDGTWGRAACYTDGFLGDFDPSLWTYSAGPTDNAILDLSNVPDAIGITASDNGVVDVNTNTDLCIDIQCDGTLSFTWTAMMLEDQGRFSNDEPAYTLNGSEVELATGAISSASGNVSINVIEGDQFCFRVKSNNRGGRAMMSVSNLLITNGVVPDTDINGDGVLDVELNGNWDENGNGYPDVNEVGVPTLGGLPIYPTPDFYCNAGVFYSDVVLPQIDCVQKVMRVWSIREWWCGQELERNCTQIIEIKDITAPEVLCPADITVSTNTTLAPHETNYHGTVTCGANVQLPVPPASDNCGTLTYDVAFPGGFVSDYNGSQYVDLPMGQNLITFTVYDDCYNSTRCEYIIDVVDETAPVTICDEFTVVSLTHPGEAAVFAQTFDDGSYDDCKLKKMLVRRMDPSNCDCHRPEFPDMDYLGEYDGHHYYVSHKNTTGFLAHRLGESMGGYLATIGSALENDWITNAIQGLADDQYFIGLTDLKYEGIPTWKNGEDITYTNYSKDFVPGIDNGDYFSINKDGEWIDFLDADDAKYIYEVEDICGFSAYAHFCCADLADNDHMVVFRTVDSYGNYNDCMVNVEVQDKLIPQITCPANVTVDCDEAYLLDDMTSFGEAFVTQNCEATMVEVMTGELNQCNVGRITRTFIATNSNGVQDSCHQYITFVNPDEFEYDDIIWPEDRLDFPGCDDPNNFGPDVTGSPEFISDVCDLVGANYEDQVFIFNGEEDSGCFKILRHWTVIDWCQTYTDPSTGLPRFRTWERQQIIKVTNDVVPTIVECTDTTFCHYDPECGDATFTFSASAMDDCTTDLKWEYAIDANRTGVFDIESVVFQGTANDQGITVATVDLELPDGKHTIVWRFYDNCGNLVSCSEDFEIKNCKAPTPYCINGLAVDLMPIDSTGDGVFDFGMVELWASDFDAGSYHPCTDEIFLSFTPDTADRFMMFDCTTLGDQPVNIYASIVGAHGELIQAFCETFVNVQDNNNACGGTGTTIQTRISGSIRTEMDERIEDVEVALQGSDEIAMTDIDGNYAFPDMPVGGAYLVNPFKNDDPLNGVSTLDLVLIQRHILGLRLLDSPYKIIAGDINHDDEVSSIDLVELRKLILGIYDDIPNNTSWRFIDDEYAFIDETDPLNENFTEIYNIPTLNSDMVIDFTGVKVGDVDNSMTTNILGNDLENRNRRSLELEADVITVENSGTIEIPIFLKESVQIVGMQFTFDINPQVEFSTIQSGQIEVDTDNLGFRREENGLVTFSWNDEELIALDKDQALFTLVLENTSNDDVVYPIDINSELTSSEAYVDYNTIYTPQLSYRNDLNNENEFKLYQNIPNPFRSTTEIRFTLPEKGFAELTITDVTGKLVKKLSGTFNQGLNTIEISSEDLNTNGFLYYTLKTNNNKATMKMVYVR